jgi:hypothetical protein
MQLDSPKRMLSRASIAAGMGHSSSSKRRHVLKKSKRRCNSKRRRVFKKKQEGMQGTLNAATHG